MKLKKTISFILILVLLCGVSRVVSIYAAKYLDTKYQRENGVIVGTNEIYIEKGDEAILLLHGLAASPYALKEIANFYATKGYTVYVPVIKGHGTSVFDLEKTNYLDWRNSAEQAYDKLSKNHSKIYVIGASLGGLLALDLASDHDVKGVVVLNTPIEFKSELSKVLPLVYLVSPYLIRGLFTLEELPVATELKLYDSLPLKSAAQLLSYIEFIKPKLKNINAPIFVIQSVKDDLVELESASFILNNINSKNEDLLFLKNSTHINIIKEDREIFKQRSYKFINSLEVNNV